MGLGSDVMRTVGNQGKANVPLFSLPVMCGNTKNYKRIQKISSKERTVFLLGVIKKEGIIFPLPESAGQIPAPACQGRHGSTVPAIGYYSLSIS